MKIEPLVAAFAAFLNQGQNFSFFFKRIAGPELRGGNEIPANNSLATGEEAHCCEGGIYYDMSSRSIHLDVGWGNGPFGDPTRNLSGDLIKATLNGPGTQFGTATEVYAF